MAASGTAKILQLKSPATQNSANKKWGKAVCELGFSIIPSLIFKAQARLGLDSTQLVILLQIADHWWTYEGLPYPSKATIAERVNLSPRQVQRHLADLEKRGYIKRIDRFASHKGQQSNFYDLTGLVKELQKLEPEFTKVAQQNRLVSKRGGIPKTSN